MPGTAIDPPAAVTPAQPKVAELLAMASGQLPSGALSLQSDRVKGEITVTIANFPEHKVRLGGLSAAGVDYIEQEFTGWMAQGGTGTDARTWAGAFDLLQSAALRVDRFSKSPKPVVSVDHTVLRAVPIGELVNDHQRYNFENWGDQKTTSSGVTKAALLSIQGCEDLFRRLGDKVVVASCDYRAVGLANDYGYRKEVDQVFQITRERLTKELASRGELIPWGGDERVLVLREDTHKEVLDRFIAIANEVREEIFPEGDPRFGPLMAALRFREAFRAVGKDVLAMAHRAEDEIAGEIERKYPGTGARAEALKKQYPILERADLGGVAILTLAAAQIGIEKGTTLPPNFFLGISGGLISFDAGQHGCTPTRFFQTVAQGFRHQLNTKMGAAFDSLIPFNPDIPLRDSDRKLLDVAEKLGRAKEELTRLGRCVQGSTLGFAVIAEIDRAIKRGDSGLSRVDGSPLFALRDVETKTMPVSKLGFNGSVHIVKFDLRPFRSFNNTLGYSEADAVFSEFVERIERAGTGLRLVRSGGSIFALSPEPIPDEVVSGVSEQISDLYREKILTAPAGVKMQFELDRARGLLDGLQRGAPFEVLAKLAEDRFNRPGVSAQRTWTGDPNTPIYDVINSA